VWSDLPTSDWFILWEVSHSLYVLTISSQNVLFQPLCMEQIIFLCLLRYGMSLTEWNNHIRWSKTIVSSPNNNFKLRFTNYNSNIYIITSKQVELTQRQWQATFLDQYYGKYSTTFAKMIVATAVFLQRSLQLARVTDRSFGKTANVNEFDSCREMSRNWQGVWEVSEKYVGENIYC